MVRIAVCDDNISELTRVAALLGQYREAHAPALHYDVFQSAMELLEAMRQTAYDVLILDILMPGVTGMQAAREIRSFDEAAHIVFLTSSPEFAVESYAVDADSYLLKPCTAEKLFPVLKKLLQRVGQPEQALTLVRHGSVTRLPLARLEVLEICNKKLQFHLEDGSVWEMPGALSDHEAALLNRPEFIKVHRAYIVNMDHIQSLDTHEAVTYAGQHVPVSRLLQAQVREEYLHYLFSQREG